jgi:hypothetical protein
VRKHVVEHGDLLVAQLSRRHQKKIGDAPKRVDPFFPRSALNRFFQFIHQRLLRAHDWLVSPILSCAARVPGFRNSGASGASRANGCRAVN